jgi:hypothetical protein
MRSEQFFLESESGMVHPSEVREGCINWTEKLLMGYAHFIRPSFAVK